MNAGLSNLTKLKQHLLPDSWQTETQLDELLAALGLGVANQLEQHCGRSFQRVVDATFECRADTALVQLPRFPLESGFPLMEIRYAGSAAWETLAEWIDQVWTSGVLQLLGEPGTVRDRLRFTFTGGYWWDTSEDASETLPETAFEIPAALQLAWLQQCKHVFAASEMMDRRALAAGAALAEAPAASYAYELLPGVVAALRSFSLLAG